MGGTASPWFGYLKRTLNPNPNPNPNPNSNPNPNTPTPTPTRFGYFKLLVVRGMLEARRHQQKLLLSVRATFVGVGGQLPCFRAGEQTIEAMVQPHGQTQTPPWAVP